MHRAQEIARHHVDADVPLMDAGLDSLGLLELCNALHSTTADVVLPDTLAFDFPTVRKLASFVERSSAGAVVASAVRRDS